MPSTFAGPGYEPARPAAGSAVVEPSPDCWRSHGADTGPGCGGGDGTFGGGGGCGVPARGRGASDWPLSSGAAGTSLLLLRSVTVPILSAASRSIRTSVVALGISLRPTRG